MNRRYRPRSSTRSAFARLVNADNTSMSTKDKLRQARRDHDALENSCVDLALLKYRVDLLKADAESFIRQDGSRGSRCTSGIPDRICAMPPTGRFVGFEFKIGKARARKNQRDVHNKLTQCGAAVYVIRSMGQFDRVMTDLMGGEKQKLFLQDIGKNSQEPAHAAV